MSKPNGAPPYLTEKNLAKNKYKKPDSYLENADAIVIGSGIGGLGISSILAQKKKWKVLLLEGNNVPGGCTHVKEIDGYEWNTGIDSIGDMDASIGRGIFRPTIDYITGGKLDWAKMPDVHELSYMDGDKHEWYSSPEKNIEWMNKMFADDNVQAKKYYKLENQIQNSAWAWAITKILPRWIPLPIRKAFYFIFGGKWRKYMNRFSTDVFLNELKFPPKLAAILSYMYGNHGVTPKRAPFAFHAANLYHYKYGAYFPVGGSGQIAECVIPIIEAAGGQMAVKSLVKEIIVEKNKAIGVELHSGEKIYSKLIISDSGAYSTFLELLPEDVSKKHGYPSLIEKVQPSVAHLYLFLGYNESIDIPQEIIWDVPSYDIETTDRKYKQEMDFNCMGTYILSPSSRDPSFSERYPNKSEIVVLAEAPHEWVERSQKDPEFKKKFVADITAHLIKIVHKRIPILKDKKPDFIQAGVPMGCNPWAWKGCSLGLGSDKGRFLENTHWLRPRTKVKNLYLTGQDAFSMGFASAMFATKLTYTAITGNWFFMAKKKL